MYLYIGESDSPNPFFLPRIDTKPHKTDVKVSLQSTFKIINRYRR